MVFCGPAVREALSGRRRPGKNQIPSKQEDPWKIPETPRDPVQ